MAFDVKNYDLYVSRGNTATFHIDLEESYTPVEGDVFVFEMKKLFTGKETLVTKNIPWNTMILQLRADDTKALPFGDYAYSITFIKGNEVIVDSFVVGKVTIGENAHHG